MNVSPTLSRTLKIGIGGAATLGALLGTPEESEAMVSKPPVALREPFKPSGKVDESISSVLDKLKDWVHPSGYKVVDVRKPSLGYRGDQNIRQVILEHPETGKQYRWEIDKDALQTLASMKGYQDYLERFQTLKSARSKFEQAKSSLEMREKLGLGGTPKEAQKYGRQYLTKAYHLADPFKTFEYSWEPVADWVYVKWNGKTYGYPKDYAETLDRLKTSGSRYMKSFLEGGGFKILKKEPIYSTTPYWKEPFKKAPPTSTPVRKVLFGILNTKTGEFNLEIGEGKLTSYRKMEKRYPYIRLVDNEDELYKLFEMDPNQRINYSTLGEA